MSKRCKLMTTHSSPPDTETITITPADARWVGAWWLGYLIAGVITLLSAIPFWFLPRSLPMSGPRGPEKCTPEQKSFMKHKYPADEHASFTEMAKGEGGSFKNRFLFSDSTTLNIINVGKFKSNSTHRGFRFCSYVHKATACRQEFPAATLT